MPGQRTIYGKNTNKSLAKAVKNYNAKLTRIAKKDPEAWNYLPERMSVKEIKAEIHTRADLNDVLRSMHSFAKRTADVEPVYMDKGLVITKWEIQDIEQTNINRNAYRKKERKKIKITPEAGNRGTVEENHLLPREFKPEAMKSRAELQKFKKNAKREAQRDYRARMIENYKQLYLDTIQKELGAAGAELHAYVSKLPAELVKRGQYGDPVLNVKFISDPLHAKVIAQEALNHWKELNGEAPDLDDRQDDGWGEEEDADLEEG